MAKEYNNFIEINKFNKEKLGKILSEIFEDIIETKETKKENYINIESPLFGIISKIKDFGTYYIIYISQKKIDEYLLKEDYKILFNKLNNSNLKYSSIYYVFNEKEKLDYLKELNINYKNINKMFLKCKGNNNNEDFNNTINIFNLFQNIEHLILEGNENIINFLENANFKNLKELNLSHNNLSNIKVLEKVKFFELEKLNLSKNKILDINVLENVNLIKLKELDLSYNDISDIKIFEKVKCKELEKLNLSGNKISDINTLGKVNFKVLKEFIIYIILYQT